MSDRAELAQLKLQIKNLKDDLKKNKTKTKITKLERLKKKYTIVYQRIYHRNYYSKNPDKIKQAVINCREKNKKKYNKYMKQLMKKLREEKD